MEWLAVAMSYSGHILDAKDMPCVKHGIKKMRYCVTRLLSMEDIRDLHESENRQRKLPKLAKEECAQLKKDAEKLGKKEVSK